MVPEANLPVSECEGTDYANNMVKKTLKTEQKMNEN